MDKNNWSEIKRRLSFSKFRSKFNLTENDKEYIEKIGIDKIHDHACGFIKERLAPEKPKNDTKQTPYLGHPVFVAQHATATCCRKCLEKWHGIKRGKRLSVEEVDYVVDIIMAWIKEKL